MRHIPNIISIIRILLIPFFVWLMLTDRPYQAAAILVVSGISDFLDGFLARRFNWVSDVGKVLDPVSDKLTQVTVCVTLIIVLRQYWFFFAALLFKDLVMLTLGSYLVKNGVKLEGARWFGKVVTTMFYIIMVAIIFLGESPDGLMPPWLVVSLLSLVTVCAFIAGFLYIPEYLNYRKQLKSRKETPSEQAAE